MKPLRAITTLIYLLILFPSGAETIVHPATPVENSFLLTYRGNPGVYVNLRMENGKELLFDIDTGRPNTTLDKSLESLLGRRLGSSHFFEPFIVKGLSRVNVYNAPKLYLGNTLLLTNPKICTFNWQRYEPGVMGELGMDCLRHYCVQFDFARNKIRFLDPDHLNNGELGKPIPLTILFNLLIARADCFGAGTMYFCPDTGCDSVDAVLKPVFFRRELQRQNPLWTFGGPATTSTSAAEVGFATGIFGGKTYTDLTFGKWYGSWPDGDLVGLPFLARNLVTFNFPKRVMYLKQQTTVPRFNNIFSLGEAMHYFGRLAGKGELPGILTNDWSCSAVLNCPDPTRFPISVTFNLRKISIPHWIDVTSRLQSLVAEGARVIRADNAMAGCDPALGYPKQLSIAFSVGKLRRTAQAIEGRTVTLPAGAEIIRARYGFLQSSSVEPSQLKSRVDPSQYHYTLAKKSQDDSWQLQRAWHTDKSGRVIEQYQVNGHSSLPDFDLLKDRVHK